MVYETTYTSPLGIITLASDGMSLIGLWIEGQRYYESTITSTPQILPVSELTLFAETAAWLDTYFAGERPGPPPLLAPQGSEFRRAVWKVLSTIPYGQTITYGDVAQRLAGTRPTAPRACGGAVGHNPDRKSVV